VDLEQRLSVPERAPDAAVADDEDEEDGQERAARDEGRGPCAPFRPEEERESGEEDDEPRPGESRRTMGEEVPFPGEAGDPGPVGVEGRIGLHRASGISGFRPGAAWTGGVPPGPRRVRRADASAMAPASPSPAAVGTYQQAPRGAPFRLSTPSPKKKRMDSQLPGPWRRTRW